MKWENIQFEITQTTFGTVDQSKIFVVVAYLVLNSGLILKPRLAITAVANILLPADSDIRI